MQVIKLALFALLFTTTAFASYAPVEKVREEHRIEPQNAPQSTKLPRNELELLIEKYAQIYSISPLLMKEIIKCESSFNVNAKNITEREESYGLVQINLLAHTNISIEQATNPDFAIEFLAKNFNKADRMWVTCYKKAIQVQNSQLLPQEE